MLFAHRPNDLTKVKPQKVSFASFFRYGFVIPTLMGWILLLSPNLQKQILGWTQNPSRKILSIVRGDLSGQGEDFQIVKIQEADDISIEVHQILPRNNILVQKINLAHQTDAFFHYRGQATNLVLDDLNNDQQLEIITPTATNNWNTRLNVFTYNPTEKAFNRVQLASWNIKL